VPPGILSRLLLPLFLIAEMGKRFFQTSFLCLRGAHSLPCPHSRSTLHTSRTVDAIADRCHARLDPCLCRPHTHHLPRKVLLKAYLFSFLTPGGTRLETPSISWAGFAVPARSLSFQFEITCTPNYGRSTVSSSSFLSAPTFLLAAHRKAPLVPSPLPARSLS